MYGINRRSLLGSVAATAIIRPSSARLLRTNGGIFYNDGSANAPSGTAQYPTLLNGYTARAPWKVAGVDYAVGIPSSVTLKDPFGGLTPSNTNLDASIKAIGGSFSGKVLTMSGSSANNATLLGWDFSLNGGQGVVVSSCSNFTIDSCNFKVGTNLQQTVTVQETVNGFTLIRCTVDGNNQNYSPSGGLMSINAYGTTTIQYSHIRYAWGQLIEAGTSANGNPTHIVKYNVIHDAGLGFAVDGTHGDLVQYLLANTQTFDDVEFKFNVLLQNDALAVGASTQGLSMFSAGGMAANAGACLNEVYSNNTIIAKSPCLDPILINNTYLNGNATCNNNYSDVVGSNGTVWLFFGNNSGGPGGIGPYTGTLSALTGNFNMNTGASFNTH